MRTSAHIARARRVLVLCEGWCAYCQVHEVGACCFRTRVHLACARGARARLENRCAHRTCTPWGGGTRARADARRSDTARRQGQCACAARASRWSAASTAGRQPGRRGLRGPPRSPGRWPTQARCGPRRPTTGLQVGLPGCGGSVGASGPPGGGGGPQEAEVLEREAVGGGARN